MEAKRVLIYRNELLPSSETFILSQTNALRRFRPLLGGLTRVSGLDLTSHWVFTLCGRESWNEKAKRRAFLRTGYNRQLLHAVATLSPQIIHAHFAVDACAVLPVAKKLSIPLIVTLHGYDVFYNKEALKRWPTTRAYLRRREELWEYAASFMCVSDHVRRCAANCGFPQNKLQAHRIGVYLPDADRQKSLRDNRTVLFVGRLVEKKGCIHLIRAMSRVLKAIPDAQLVILGDGPLRKVLEHEAAVHCNNTVFLGFQSHNAVKQWMRRARMLVAPSVQAKNGDAEGLPMALCEAQAEGLPVIAFATDGVTEALPVERRESLPGENDTAGLAEQIIHLLENDHAWHHASDAGRRYIKSHFDLAAQTRLLEGKYEEVIAGAYA
jgi:glycosyltransferase involved in cell wall biosynthesis